MAKLSKLWYRIFTDLCIRLTNKGHEAYRLSLGLLFDTDQELIKRLLLLCKDIYDHHSYLTNVSTNVAIQMYKQVIIVYTRAGSDPIQYVRTYVSSYEPILDETLRRCSMRPEDVHVILYYFFILKKKILLN